MLYVGAAAVLVAAVSLWLQPPRWVIVPSPWMAAAPVQRALNAAAAAVAPVWAASWALAAIAIDRRVLGLLGRQGALWHLPTVLVLWSVLFFLSQELLRFFHHIPAVHLLLVRSSDLWLPLAPAATAATVVCHAAAVLLLDRAGNEQRSFALAVPLGLTALAGALVNRYLLPSIGSGISLAANLALGALGLAWVAILWRGNAEAMEHRLGSAARGLSTVPPAVLLALGIGGASLSGPGGTDRRPPPNAPNVILITVDTLRGDHLGCLGQPRSPTPHLDRLAEGAALFRKCMATAPHTVPSTASILTSRYPSYHSIGNENGTRAMSPAEETLAHVLARDGYRTAAFVSNFVLRRRMRLYRGFEVYDDTFESAERVRGVPERTAARTTAFVSNWLQNLGEQPFFLWVHYQDPHGPYTPPEAALDRFPPTADAADPEILPVVNNEGLGGIPEYQFVNSSTTPATYRAGYLGEIAHADEMIGELLEQVRALGLWENSIVVFTSDHGESMGEHDYWFCHGQSLTDELIHVPLIIRLPGADPIAIDELVSNVDVAPTILAAVGLVDALDGNGLSLLPLIDGTVEALQRQYVLAEGGHGEIGVRGRDLKYIIGPAGEQLFDLRMDPGERVNILADDPELALTLRTLAEDYRASAVAVQGGASLPQSAEEREKLRSLGYLN